MATWQYDLRVVPRQALKETVGAVPIFVPNEVLDGQLWRDHVGTSEMRSSLTELLQPSGGTWHANLEVWGSEESTRIDLWTDGDIVDDVHLRIDARSASAAFLLRIADWARKLHLAFVDSSGRVVRSNAQALFDGLANSSAAQFVADPKGFLSELEGEDEV